MVGAFATPAVLLALRAAAGVKASQLRPVDAIGRVRSPILIMTGAEDRKTTMKESQSLFARANHPKEFWAAPGAGHIDLAFVGAAGYRTRLLRFLGAALRPEAGQPAPPPPGSPPKSREGVSPQEPTADRRPNPCRNRRLAAGRRNHVEWGDDGSTATAYRG